MLLIFKDFCIDLSSVDKVIQKIPIIRNIFYKCLSFCFLNYISCINKSDIRKKRFKTDFNVSSP